MRVLSGIQPSGKLHLGNYFGMMRPVIELQRDAEVFLFIADYHALTSVSDPDRLREAIRDVALDFLACGLDPDRTVFYRQSDVPEVTELSWLLATVTPMAMLERGHSYKDKTARGIASSLGLFSYPVLMASDILIVQSDTVPVGKDQKQHLEFARDIAVKFNQQYGPVFKLPEPRIQEDVAVIPGVDGQKMSKSYGNTIEIFGPPKEARKRIMRIVTDSRTVEEPKDPGSSTVFALYALLADAAEREAMAARFRAGGMGYGDAKKAVAEKFEAHFGPMRERRESWARDPGAVDEVLRRGAERARNVARDTLDRARAVMGLDDAS
jgi:tryptophanyl-tRNA synthetase